MYPILHKRSLVNKIEFQTLYLKQRKYGSFATLTEGGKGGSRSCFTENKMVLSQFTKNKGIMKITVHGELNIYFSFHGK